MQILPKLRWSTTGILVSILCLNGCEAGPIKSEPPKVYDHLTDAEIESLSAIVATLYSDIVSAKIEGRTLDDYSGLLQHAKEKRHQKDGSDGYIFVVPRDGKVGEGAVAVWITVDPKSGRIVRSGVEEISA